MPLPIPPAAPGGLFVSNDAGKFRRRSQCFQKIVGGTERGKVMNCEGWTMNNHGAILPQLSIFRTCLDLLAISAKAMLAIGFDNNSWFGIPGQIQHQTTKRYECK